ncbi:33185_t:CDS:1, partial [Racocetra persica]
MTKEIPNAQILRELLEKYTQKELANKFRVNEKTIRRHLKPSNQERQKRGVKEKIFGMVETKLLSFTAYRSEDNTLTQQEMVDR